MFLSKCRYKTHDHSEEYIGKHQRLVEPRLHNKEWIEIRLDRVFR